MVLLHKVLGAETGSVHEEDELIADLGLESVQVLRLVALLETEFELRLSLDELSSVHTWGQLMDFLDAKNARGGEAVGKRRS